MTDDLIEKVTIAVWSANATGREIAKAAIAAHEAWLKEKGRVIVSKAQLQKIVDLTWGHALEDTSVPSYETSDTLIEQAMIEAAQGGEK